MANWRDTILKNFKPKISRLTLVADPDELLTEEGMLSAIRDRGFDLMPFDDAIRFHIDPTQPYNPAAAGIDRDLIRRMGPRIAESYLDPMFRNGGIDLSESQIRDVTQFIKTGLLDPRAEKDRLCGLIPKSVPSGFKVLTFEACENKPGKN